MRIILLELKKLFRLRNCGIALAVLFVLCINVPKRQTLAINRTHTQNYPAQYTFRDAQDLGYSVNMQFNDFLLNTYGETVTEADLEDLRQRRQTLLEQVIVAAATDPILLRTQTSFNPEQSSFVSPLAPGSEAQSTSAEDEVYIWSCVNGQMRLPGTDYPVGFLSLFQKVIDTIETSQYYRVIDTELIWELGNILPLITYFTLAALVLVIPYCVSEARSKVQTISYTTKAGRKSYLYKLLATGLVSAMVIGMGVLFSSGLFLQWDVSRYYSVTVIPNLSVTYLQLFEISLLFLFLAGLAVCVLVSIISFHFPQVITALACALPIILGLVAFQIVYVSKGFGYNTPILTQHPMPLYIASSALLLSVLVALFESIRQKKSSF